MVMNRFVRFCYKWLPIIFGCHCRPDRSFFYKGHQFPVCARCTGMLIGMLLAPMLFVFWVPNVPFLILLMLPLIIDGSLQMKTKYVSTNRRRCCSGVLFGYAIVSLFILFLSSGFNTGVIIGEYLKKALHSRM